MWSMPGDDLMMSMLCMLDQGLIIAAPPRWLSGCDQIALVMSIRYIFLLFNPHAPVTSTST
jgi:hypothetical protein